MYLLSIFCTLFNFQNPQTQVFQSDSTEAVRIHTIVLKGNEKTKTDIIMREVEIAEGDTLSRKALKEKVEFDRRKIFNLNIFVKVDTEIKELPNNEVDVTFTVKENWFIVPNFIFILADRNFAEWWNQRNADWRRVVYGVHVVHSNFRGRNEKLKIGWESGFAQRVELSYRKPYVNQEKTIGINFGFSYATTRNVAYRSTFDKLTEYRSQENIMRERTYGWVGASYRPSFYDYHSIGFTYNNVSITDSIANLNPNYFPSGSTRLRYLNFGYNFTHDYRDNVIYPLRGNLIQADVVQTGILPTDEFFMFSISGSYTHFFDLGKKFFANIGFKQKFSFPAKQPFYLARALGYGNELVRGYEQYVVDGPNFSLLKSNLRYQLLDKQWKAKFLPKQFNVIPFALYLNAFVDAGYVTNDFSDIAKSRLTNSLLIGYGLGLDMVSFYNVLWRFNYGFNRQGESGFVFSIFRDF
jgi:outer membrane protein assembly factor BamA